MSDISERLDEILAEYKIGFQLPPDLDINQHLAKFKAELTKLIDEQVLAGRIDELKSLPTDIIVGDRIVYSVDIENRLTELNTNPTKK